MTNTYRPLLLIPVYIIVYYLIECTAELTSTTVQESTVGFSLIQSGSFIDNTVILRAVRLDYTNGVCNEPKVSLRTVIPGQGATVYALDLGKFLHFISDFSVIDYLIIIISLFC
jgi:hypothetical protein